MDSSSTLSFYCFTFVFLAAVASAAHSAPPPGADCANLITSMAPCLSYVTVGGTDQKPEAMCCSGLKTVLKTDAECLCEAFKSSAQLGVTLNMTKALALPTACHISAPSISNCGLSNAPGAAPALSPMALSPNSVAGGPMAGSGASEAASVPAPGGPSSSAATISIGSVVFTIVAAVSLGLF